MTNRRGARITREVSTRDESTLVLPARRRGEWRMSRMGYAVARSMDRMVYGRIHRAKKIAGTVNSRSRPTV